MLYFLVLKSQTNELYVKTYHIRPELNIVMFVLIIYVLRSQPFQQYSRLMDRLYCVCVRYSYEVHGGGGYPAALVPNSCPLYRQR